MAWPPVSEPDGGARPDPGHFLPDARRRGKRASVRASPPASVRARNHRPEDCHRRRGKRREGTAWRRVWEPDEARRLGCAGERKDVPPGAKAGVGWLGALSPPGPLSRPHWEKPGDCAEERPRDGSEPRNVAEHAGRRREVEREVGPGAHWRGARPSGRCSERNGLNCAADSACRGREPRRKGVREVQAEEPPQERKAVKGSFSSSQGVETIESGCTG